MPNFLRTYDELTELVIAARAQLYRENPGALQAVLSPDEVMFWIGCKFFEVDLDYPDQAFRSNRYFLDSIGMKLLPNPARVHAIEVVINSRPELLRELEQLYFVSLDAAGLVRFDSSSSFDFDHFSEKGYAILEGVIDPAFCDELTELVAEHAALELRSSRGGYVYGDGRMQRLYNLVAKGWQFRRLLEDALIHEALSRIFHRDTFHNKYYLTSFHANILGPGAAPQIWHIDANVPEPLPEWNIRVNANFVIQEYTRSNGATEVVPGSHRLRRKPTAAEVHRAHPEAVPLEVPKGAVVLWHGYLWHRSGQNQSMKNRIALLSTYAAGFLREVCLEENVYLSSSLAVQRTFSPRIKRILGWNHGLKDYGE